MQRLKRIAIGLLVLAVAAAIWVPCLHLVFARKVTQFRQAYGLSPKARQLAARHLQLWTDPATRQKELDRMRASNAEWDFMGRSFLVWSLANMGMRDPGSKSVYLKTIDEIIDETLRLEKEKFWIFKVRDALDHTYTAYPFLAYGTDWLAFGHFIIALAFVGALRDPVRNRWLYQFGMISCVLVIPYALICGGVRGIPVYWRLIDCSFGVFGFIPLWFCWKWTGELEKTSD